MFPPNDDQFEDTHIAKATKHEDGSYTIDRADGWSFLVPKDSIIKPEAGMPARFYGKGIGSTVRGLFICGIQVFYRTEEEDKARHEIELFGEDAADWLARWDAGKTVWSIKMGGLGPGYEQAIQITAAEILRHLLEAKYDAEAWQDKDAWKRDREAIEKAGFANKTISDLGGITGAQHGAAMNIAVCLYRDGPRHIMGLEEIKDRHIQVSRDFPGMKRAA